MATEFFKGEIYGSVLRCAYLLEQHVAQYPRVVVGPQAMSFLQEIASGVGNTGVDRLNKSVAKDCLSAIAIDEDGTPFVDFLGDHVHNLLRGEQMPVELVKQGYEFVKKEHERFKQSQNHKLALRYALLRRYYEARMGRWT